MPVKPKYVKDLGRAIYRKYPQAVTRDFDSNKELVQEVTNIESKTVINRVAGFLSRLKAIEENKSESELK